METFGGKLKLRGSKLRLRRNQSALRSDLRLGWFVLRPGLKCPELERKLLLLLCSGESFQAFARFDGVDGQRT